MDSQVRNCKNQVIGPSDGMLPKLPVYGPRSAFIEIGQALGADGSRAALLAAMA